MQSTFIKNFFLKIIILCGISASIVLTNKSYPTGYPVVDFAVNALELSQESLNLDQLVEIQQTYQQIQAIYKTLGQLKNIDFKPFIKNLTSALFKELNPGPQFETIANYLPKQFQPELSDDSFTTIKNAREAILSLLYNKNITSVTEANYYKKTRHAALQEAVIQAYANALHNKQVITEYSETTDQLTKQISESEDIINQIASNTAVLLKLHEQLSYIQGLLATIAEIEAAHIIYKDPLISAPSQYSGIETDNLNINSESQ